MRSQKRTETLVESGVDCITSSYGVGPTDELGRPLFGLRALRRSNTNKQLTDDVEVRQEEPRLSKEEPVSDSRGRPLFGGLKALRAIETYEDSSEMPEQTSTQLRELVQHHEKVVRETNGPQDQPKQKPRAKLRDSFISTEDEPSSPGHLSEVNSLNRGFSLKSIIQKHENIANTGGVVRNEMESSHTVVTSRSVMASDGSVSLSRDVIQGEISAKNGEEPVGKVTRTQYTYQSPQGDDKGVNKVTTTTTALGGRRTSGPRITEIEDEPQRKSSLKTSNKRSSVTEVTEEVSGRKASERITNRRGSLRKSPSEDEDRKTDRRFSNQQDEENTQKVTSRVSSTQKFTTSDDSATNKRISSTTTRQTETRSTTSSPSLRRQKSSEEESTAEDKRKTVVRGDSVRALQHKFQQATENAVNSAPRNSSTRAGLILRTSSFTNADQQESVSSTLKQSTNLSAEKRNGRQSPDKSRREATDVTSRKGSLSDAISTRRDSLTKTSSDVTSRRESMTKDSTSSTTSSRVVETHQTSSFLDNTSRVTGVQDILTRMRNADLVNESGDTDADREARALLNKFLGASVILQGMEQGMRSAGIPSDAVQDSPVGSAALVRSVEKQRVATTRQKEEDIENIWDEQVLKSLLERCTDYEGRRKLRARLRTVMAEHKACADLVAVTGDNGANSSHREGECPLSSPSSGVDDSGTESGEDFRLLSPEILAEVQNALTRLETALPGLDPTRREALVRLVNRLQSCLKLQPPTAQPTAPSLPTPPEPAPAPQPQPLPPVKRYANRRQRQQRHTVGVSKEELADARRWLLETGLQKQEVPLEPVDSKSSTNLVGLQEQKAISQVFRPVKFNPNQTKVSEYELITQNNEPSDISIDAGEEPVILNAALTYSTFPCEVPKADSGSSLLEYDPSLVLFTPAQSVQIAVHKAAINKQISEEESKRENRRREESYDSEDEDISSVEEDQSPVSGQVLEDAISSAQRLLQIATDKKTPIPSRFHDRNSKKQKMKRANTIDIPKPNKFQETEDEYDGTSKDDLSKYSEKNGVLDKKIPQPAFIPKTESDLKFLAFLQQANKQEGNAGTYNPSARGGQHWTNRFVNLKTAFEPTSESKHGQQVKTSQPSITQIWENSVNKTLDPPLLRHAVQNRTPQPLQNKHSWNSKQEEEGVVIGSLIVKTAPGPVNKFSHAPKSAFKPIEKKPVNLSQNPIIQPQKLKIIPQNITTQLQNKPIQNINQGLPKTRVSENDSLHGLNNQMKTSASGTVKKLAAQKFSGEIEPTKPIYKQYPVIQDKDFNATNTPKQKSEKTLKCNTNVPSEPFILPPQQFTTSIASAHRQFTSQSDPETAKIIKIPQKPLIKDYKEGSEYSPPKQYINSPPLSKNYSEAFDYPIEVRDNNLYPTVSDYQSNYELQDSQLDENAVPYYSQPAFVQHSTYAQPLDSLPSSPANTSQLPFKQQNTNQLCNTLPEPVPNYSVGYAQEYNVSNTQPELYHMHSAENKKTVIPNKFQKQSGQIPAVYIQNTQGELPRHSFSEESLVPNPLVLSKIYKTTSTPSEYFPHSTPERSTSYEPSSEASNYERHLVASNKQKPPLISNNFYENNSSQGSLTSMKLRDSSLSVKQYLNIPFECGQETSPVISNTSKSPYFDESVSSSSAPSPHLYHDDFEDNQISISEGTEMQTAVARVMGQSQCQKAVTVSNRTKHRFDDNHAESESLLRTLLKSPHSPTSTGKKPSLEKGNVLTEPLQPSKSPHFEKSSKSKVSSNSATKSSTTISHQNSRLQSLQNKPVSAAASAFRPLVHNLSKPLEPELHSHPPIPPSPQVYSKKSETDSKFQQNTNKSTPFVSVSNSSKFYESELPPKPYSSPCRSPSSPSFPNVLQKSESWHQLVKEQMAQGRHPPPKSPRLSKTKSSHTLAFPKQYEAHLTPEVLAVKQSTVDQYLKPTSKQQFVKTTMQTSKLKQTSSVAKIDENLDNVDEAFETLFQEVAKRK